jgi:outer membrane protein OmpA-like peptidoglycan-associated protein
MRARHGRLSRAALSISCLVLVSCSNSADSGAGADTGALPAGSEPALDQPQPPTEDPACSARAGRVVEELPDVTVPARHVEPVRGQDGELLVDGYTIGPMTLDGGCVVRHDAPGGCLGAVEVTGVSIPATTLPGVRVGGVELPGVAAPAVTAPGAAAEQVCQVADDGRLGTVTRPGVVRERLTRNGIARPGGTAEGVVVPTVRIPAVSIEGVDVDPERLERRDLPGSDVSMFTGAGKTSFTAPSRVLFDTDEAAIRPAAVEALRDIARRIEEISPNAGLLVEGHTDDRGDELYGLELSERRAEAVADWLVGRAGFDRARIRTRGLGESAPTVPNTSDRNRQRNRRVVITLRGQ